MCICVLMCVYDVCVCECACVCMHVCMCVCAYEPMYTRPKSVQLHFASFLFTQKKLLTCTSHDKQAKNLEDFFSKKESLLSPKPSYILDVRKKRSHSLTYSRQFQHKPNAVKPLFRKRVRGSPHPRRVRGSATRWTKRGFSVPRNSNLRREAGKKFG